MAEKAIFDAWINSQINFDGQAQGLVQYRMNGGIRQYESDIVINQYDRAGNQTYFATIQDAFPTSVSAMNTNWSDQANPHRLTVSFMFTKWLSNMNNPNGAFENPSITNFANQLVADVNSVTSTINNVVQDIERIF
jgi:hypothetical protein